jgi:hypothetical protein
LDPNNHQGWLNIFSPLKPYGTYSINLELYDEWLFLKLVLDLSAATGHTLVEDTAAKSESDYGIADLYAKKANLPKVGKVHFKMLPAAEIKEQDESPTDKDTKALLSDQHQKRVDAKLLAAKKLIHRQSLPFLKYVLLGTKPIDNTLKELPTPGDKIIKAEQARNHIKLLNHSFLKKPTAKSAVAGWLTKDQAVEKPKQPMAKFKSAARRSISGDNMEQAADATRHHTEAGGQ